MMEWFRWYHGACSDPKWPIIARKAKVSVGVVVSVWAALLEYASQDAERGSVEGFDGETYDALYGYEDGTCDAILDAMMEKGLICDGCICAWRKRQPLREREDSTNAERQRRFRERQRQGKGREGVTDGGEEVTPRNITSATRNATCNAVTPGNASVTPPEQNREEQRREDINTPPTQEYFNNLNTRVRVEPPQGGGGEVESHVPDGFAGNENGCRDGPAKTDAPSKGHPEWAAFLSCWELWPVKQGQEEAWREWMRLHANGTLAPSYVIREAIAAMIASDSRWRRGKVPRMAKWLHGKGWEDKPFIEPQDGGTMPVAVGREGPRSYEDVIAAADAAAERSRKDRLERNRRADAQRAAAAQRRDVA